jgi:hypothetical protein
MMWYYARVRWAVMVEGRGLRQWKESMFLFQAVDREAAFQRALELGKKRQETQERRQGWVDKRLAEIIELDELWDGEQIELGTKPADRTIAFEHQFEPERSEPRPAF